MQISYAIIKGNRPEALWKHENFSENKKRIFHYVRRRSFERL